MRRYLLLLFTCITFVSCSVSKQINQVANHTLLAGKEFKNAHTGISIYDPVQSKMIYSYQGDKYFVPASNTKLTSCYLAMKYLGDSIPGIKYNIVDDTTVMIAGTGDPTFLRPDFMRQPVFDFLKNFKRILYVPSGFDQFLGSGWSWDDYTEDYMAPRSSMPMYGDVVMIKSTATGAFITPEYFNKDLVLSGNIADGFTAERPWAQNIFYLKPGKSHSSEIPYIPYDSTLVHLLSDTLHRQVSITVSKIVSPYYVYSQPLDSMLAIMMHRSDNFFAEQSLLMVSEKLLGTMDDRQIIREVLSKDFAGLQQPSWVDGSGLSHYNLFSPDDFVFILNKMRNEFGLERMKAILPTGGTGTLSSLYKEASGYIFAKTGTLNGVVALSGYLITKKNRLLIFSVLVNNHRGSASVIRKGIEKFITNIRDKY